MYTNAQVWKNDNRYVSFININASDCFYAMFDLHIVIKIENSGYFQLILSISRSIHIDPELIQFLW